MGRHNIPDSGLVTYAAANCAQSLGIVYYLVQTKLPSVSKSASASGASPQRSRIAQLRHAGGFFFDKMVTEFVVVAGILLTYAGLMWPIIVLAWVLAVRNVLWMTLQTVHRYFYSVPEVAHQKATV